MSTRCYRVATAFLVTSGVLALHGCGILNPENTDAVPEPRENPTIQVVVTGTVRVSGEPLAGAPVSLGYWEPCHFDRPGEPCPTWRTRSSTTTDDDGWYRVQTSVKRHSEWPVFWTSCGSLVVEVVIDGTPHRSGSIECDERSADNVIDFDI